jgi:hypothetical protein
MSCFATSKIIKTQQQVAERAGGRTHVNIAARMHRKGKTHSGKKTHDLWLQRMLDIFFQSSFTLEQGF